MYHKIAIDKQTQYPTSAQAPMIKAISPKAKIIHPIIIPFPFSLLLPISHVERLCFAAHYKLGGMAEKAAHCDQIRRVVGATSNAKEEAVSRSRIYQGPASMVAGLVPFMGEHSNPHPTGADF
jgi:hypothetical protein